MYKISNTEIEVIQGDITMLDVDAIVNPANNYLMHGGGLAAAISKRGGPSISQESKKIGFVPTGSAVYTTAGSLKAKHVIHAIGPKYKDGKSGEAEKLESAVKAALDIANGKKLKSIAIPAISTGIYGYPTADASKIITSAIVGFLKAKVKEKQDTTLEKIILCLIDNEAFKQFESDLAENFKEK